MREFEAVIGLEVHAELLTRSKMFCGCSTTFGAPPNTQTCPVCLGMPGVLPVINRRGVEHAVRTALALHCAIAPVSRFARKNYYYPDLPKAYQISQYELPLSEHGYSRSAGTGPEARGDPPRSPGRGHGQARPRGSRRTRFQPGDYNRCGVPLMEIVSDPDLRAPARRRSTADVRAVLVYLGVCDGNMEEGSFRCDANISIRPTGATELGVKVEVKNMNSFKNVQKALEYEIRRQVRAVAEGERLVQETRLWNADQESPSPCEARSTPTTIATSPIRTWCPWRSSRPGSRRFGADFRSCRTPSASDSFGSTASRRTMRAC